MRKTLILLFALFICVAATGCSVLKKPCGEVPESPCPKPAPPRCVRPTGTSPCNVEEAILETAQSIEQSLNTLAAAETAESAPILNTLPLVTCEGGMGGTANIDWTGPIGPLVEKIAGITNYRVKVLGNEPAIPILVAITAKKTVIADILQNASFQAGRRAQILVFPANRVIEVRYLS